MQKYLFDNRALVSLMIPLIIEQFRPAGQHGYARLVIFVYIWQQQALVPDTGFPNWH